MKTASEIIYLFSQWGLFLVVEYMFSTAPTYHCLGAVQPTFSHSQFYVNSLTLSPPNLELPINSFVNGSQFLNLHSILWSHSRTKQPRKRSQLVSFYGHHN